ncbi:MAG TPA: ABC transporter substrate-binding protein [Jiangellaceae bacterium]
MRSKMTRVAVLTAGLAFALTACGDDNGDDDSTGGENGDEASAEDLNLISEGTLTVCSDLPYAVFEFEDPDAPSGYSGFDIDLMQEMADRLDLELEVIVTSFDAIESGTAMAADQCDLAASAMTITEERAENIAFSDPYFETGQSLLVPTDGEATSLEDFGGLSLGVQAATTGEDYAEENAPEDTEIVGMPDDPTLRQAIEAGSIQGILQDFDTNLTITDELEGYEIAEVYETGEEYGFGMKPEGKEALLEQVNTLLGEMREDGTYDEIHSEYFSAN